MSQPDLVFTSLLGDSDLLPLLDQCHVYYWILDDQDQWHGAYQHGSDIFTTAPHQSPTALDSREAMLCHVAEQDASLPAFAATLTGDLFEISVNIFPVAHQGAQEKEREPRIENKHNTAAHAELQVELKPEPRLQQLAPSQSQSGWTASQLAGFGLIAIALSATAYASYKALQQRATSHPKTPVSYSG